MATTTFSTIFRKFDAAAAEPRRAHKVRPNPYRLRALPNEDMYFYRKRIDNSRLVREDDPRQRGECWSTIGAVSALAVVLITSLTPNVAGIREGYRIQALKQEQQRLVDERLGLEVEEARLVGVERLGGLAKEQAMMNPKPGQVVHLSGANAGEGTVALLKSKKEKGK